VFVSRNYGSLVFCGGVVICHISPRHPNIEYPSISINIRWKISVATDTSYYRNKDTHTVPGGSGYMSYVPESANDAVLSLICRIHRHLLLFFGKSHSLKANGLCRFSEQSVRSDSYGFAAVLILMCYFIGTSAADTDCLRSFPVKIRFLPFLRVSQKFLYLPLVWSNPSIPVSSDWVILSAGQSWDVCFS